MYVFCDPSGHQPLHCRKTRVRLSRCSTTTPPTQSQEAQNLETELHMCAVQLVSVTLQIVREMSQICDLCSILGIYLTILYILE